MVMKTLSKEFIFDCQVRDLAPRTIRNYEKQFSVGVSIDILTKFKYAGAYFLTVPVCSNGHFTISLILCNTRPNAKKKGRISALLEIFIH